MRLWAIAPFLPMFFAASCGGDDGAPASGSHDATLETGTDAASDAAEGGEVDEGSQPDQQDESDAGFQSEIGDGDAGSNAEAGDADGATALLCGNGNVDPGEACDDGFRDVCGSCNEDCSGPGDGRQ